MKGNSKLLWAKNLKRERDENASLSRSVGMLKVKLKTVQDSDFSRFPAIDFSQKFGYNLV